jgi:hypothetical protein
MSKLRSTLDSTERVKINGKAYTLITQRQAQVITLQLRRKDKLASQVNLQVKSGKGKISNLETEKKFQRRGCANFLLSTLVKTFGSKIKLTLSLNIKGKNAADTRERLKHLIPLFKRHGFDFTAAGGWIMEHQSSARKSIYRVKEADSGVIDTSFLQKPFKKIKYEELKRTRHFWQELSEVDFERYLEAIFQYYRRTGFPFYPTGENYRRRKLAELMRTDITNIIQDKEIKQSLAGISLAWSYHPHAWSIPCSDKRSVLDTFNDDDLLRHAIRKHLRFKMQFSNPAFISTIRIFTGTQGVSNFRPTAAAGIYDYFEARDVWDMSGGFGGRMLGAHKSRYVRSYTCTDPSTKTHAGLVEMSEFLRDSLSRGVFNKEAAASKKRYEALCLGSEDYHPEKHSLDLCFTSPPYFNCERYADEGTQSFKKFPEYDHWVNGFLHQTFVNCFRGLKPLRFMLINIANIRGHTNLESETVRVAEEVGFKYVDCMYLTLSRQGAGQKREPVFVFKKPLPAQKANKSSSKRKAR